MHQSKHINLCLPRAAREDALGFMHALPFTTCLLIPIHLSNQQDVKWNALGYSITPIAFTTEACCGFYSGAKTRWSKLPSKKMSIGMEMGPSAGSLMGGGGGWVDKRSNSSSISVARHYGDKSPALWHREGVPCPWWLIWINTATSTLKLIAD